jgi:hypothetical protein
MTTKTWRVFAEGHNGVGSCCSYGGFLTGQTIADAIPAYDARFWHNDKSGTDQWVLHYDGDLDGNADWSTTSPSLGFTVGEAYGETGRRGVTTAARDHHQNLQWLANTNPRKWYDWENNEFYYDSICEWDYSRISDTEYETVAATC